MRLLLAVLCLGLSACALFERSQDSGYLDAYDSEANIYQQRQAKSETDAREELGFTGRELNDRERSMIENRLKLKRQEALLANKREKKQYYQLRSHLANDRERLYFLSLPTYEARERWAQNRGLNTQDDGYSDEVAQTIESNDIALGMSQKAVLESWGDPDTVEVAGNAVYGYERWRYNRYVSGDDGYQKENRIIYFEGGRVVGWERN